MMFLLPLIARVGIPQRFQKAAAYIVLTVALVAFLGLAKHFYDNAVEARYEAKVQAHVAKATEAANAAASEAVTATQTEVEKGNDKARDAASGSADPLKSGIDSLRAKGSPGPAPR